MAEGAEFDLVSIGGGFAGLVAALRGAELGLRTAVIEKGDDERYLCSSRWAGGIFHVSYHDVKLPPAELKAAIERATSGETDPELAAAIAEDLRPHGRLACGARRTFHQRQPDRLASLDAGAAARSGARPGLARPRSRPDDRRAEGPARTAPGSDVSRDPRDGAADRGRSMHRGRSLARRCRSDARGPRCRDRRRRLPGRQGAVPATYRPATRARPAAPRRHRGRRRIAHGRGGRRGIDPARPVLRPSAEPRRDARRRIVAVSADRRGRDRRHRRRSQWPADGRRGTWRHFDHQ